jgi:hypothetical protein
MGAQVVWGLLVIGSMAAFGCGGDSFKPGELQGDAETGASQSGSSGGDTQSTQETGGTSARGGVQVGGAGSHSSTGGRTSSAASGGALPAATGATGGTRPAAGGSTAAGGSSTCSEAGSPSIERVVVSCVPDEETRKSMYQCTSSLAQSWRAAVGQYLACASCDDVRVQLDCLLCTCSNDPDGELTAQDLVDNCAGTALAASTMR